MFHDAPSSLDDVVDLLGSYTEWLPIAVDESSDEKTQLSVISELSAPLAPPRYWQNLQIRRTSVKVHVDLLSPNCNGTNVFVVKGVTWSGSNRSDTPSSA